MTTLGDRNATALLVVDVQRDVVGPGVDAEGVVARIGSLVQRARDEGTPVVWVQHADAGLEHGSPGWQLVDGLSPAPGEPLVHKEHADSFEGTTLEAELAGLSAGRLVVTGAQTDVCIRSTIHGAFTRGYDVTLVSDAHTTEDLSAYGAPPPDSVIAHTNLYWSYQTAPGRTAEVVPTTEVRWDVH